MKRAVVACAVVLVVAAACGGGDDAGPIAQPTGTDDATPAATPCVLEDATKQDRERPSEEPFSATSDLRYSESAGCPRVVFEFGEEHVPGYKIGYAEPPFSECGSGEEIDVGEWDASAYLSVRMEPSGTGDPDTGQPVYEGPRDIAVDGEVLKHIRRICDFEAVNEWVIGLDDELAFDISTFDDPSRLVIDVSQGGPRD